MTKHIVDPRLLETAWNRQYLRLSQHFSRLLPKQGIVAEIGCGRGQLTIPLAIRRPKGKIIGVDRFKGPYSNSHKMISYALSGRSRKLGIRLAVSDYRSWLEGQPDSRFDAIISSEFLPEIDAKSMRNFFVDCYRVLKPRGKTVHSFLSSKPHNASQRRLIEADSDPRWTKTPPAEWFSPNPRRVLEYLKLAGFERPSIKQLKSGLIIRSNAARQLLRDWDIRQAYWLSHQTALEKEGFEVPDWMIIGAVKPS